MSTSVLKFLMPVLLLAILPSCNPSGDTVREPESDTAETEGLESVSFEVEVIPASPNGRLWPDDLKREGSVLSRRFAILGVERVSLKYRPEENIIVVSIPGNDRDEIRKNLERALNEEADVRFLPVHPRNTEILAEGKTSISGWTLWEHRFPDSAGELHREKLLLSSGPPVLSARDIASVRRDHTRKGVLDLTLTEEAGRALWNCTSAMAKGRDRMAIIVNGTVRSAPVVQSNLSARVAISGLDDEEEIDELVRFLEAGAYHNKLVISDDHAR